MPETPDPFIEREDAFGLPVSWGTQPPRGHAVLYTGQRGSGVTTELDRAEAYARERGMIVFRVDASPREPLESRFSRAVAEAVPDLQQEFGRLALRSLRKTEKQMAGMRLIDTELAANVGVNLKAVQAGLTRTGGETVELNPATLTQFADVIGDLVRHRAESTREEPGLGGAAQGVLIVDNAELASDRDRAALNELASHLNRAELPVELVVGGGVQAGQRLLNASTHLTGVEANIGKRYDIRELKPWTSEEMDAYALDRLGDTFSATTRSGLDSLTAASLGNPRRLRGLVDEARAIGGSVLTPDIARTAQRADAERNQIWFEALWNNSNGAERELLASVVAAGPDGLLFEELSQNVSPARWAELDETRASLYARGLLRDGSLTLRVADHGMRWWVQHNYGDSIRRVAPTTEPIGTAMSQAATGLVAAPGDPAAAAGPSGDPAHDFPTSWPVGDPPIGDGGPTPPDGGVAPGDGGIDPPDGQVGRPAAVVDPAAEPELLFTGRPADEGKDPDRPDPSATAGRDRAAVVERDPTPDGARDGAAAAPSASAADSSSEIAPTAPSGEPARERARTALAGFLGGPVEHAPQPDVSSVGAVDAMRAAVPISTTKQPVPPQQPQPASSPGERILAGIRSARRTSPSGIDR